MGVGLDTDTDTVVGQYGGLLSCLLVLTINITM